MTAVAETAFGREAAGSSRVGNEVLRPIRIDPLVPLLAALATGIVCDRFTSLLETQGWLALALGALTVWFFGRGWALVGRVAVLAAVLAIGGAWHHRCWSDLDPEDLSWRVTESPQPVWLRGTIAEMKGLRAGPGYGPAESIRVVTRAVAELRAINDGQSWSRTRGRALVVIEGDRTDLSAGKPFEAAGRISLIPGPLNPGEFNHQDSLRGQGIRLRLVIDDPGSILDDPGGAEWPWTRRLAAWRTACRRLLDRGLDDRSAPLAAALILGQRDEIDPEVDDAFARTGTTHLLAISGLQLQALALAVGWILRTVGMPRRMVDFGVALGIGAYATLVGPAPSVVRSAVMTWTFCLASLLGRSPRPANTLALAGIATLTLNPSFLFDVGCQLSFLAVAALIWLVPPAQAIGRNTLEILRQPSQRAAALDVLATHLLPARGGFLESLVQPIAKSVVLSALASLVVWGVTLPLVALRFHLFTPIAILLNVPLLSLTSLALLLGATGMGLAAVSVPLARLFLGATHLLLGGTEMIVRWGAAQNWGHRFVAGPSPGWVLVFYVVLLGATTLSNSTSAAGLRAPSVSRRLAAFAWLVVAAWALPGWLFRFSVPGGSGLLRGQVLAVGHGLAVLLQTPEGQNILYDCGRMGDPRVGRRVIAPALWSQGVNRLSAVYLSHADQDHYNGLPDLLERIQIREVVIPFGFTSDRDPGGETLLAMVRRCGVAIRTVSAPAEWCEGGARFRVLHPPANWHPEASDNARSLVLEVSYDGGRVLLTGDIDQLGLVELVDSQPPERPVDLMLAPHHGGKTANPSSLYDWAQPRAVVVSQRPVPDGGRDALAARERSGTPVLRTWQRGALAFELGGGQLAIRGFRDRDSSMSNGSTQQPHSAASGWPSSLLAASRPMDGLGWRILLSLAGFAFGWVVFTVLAIVEFGAWALVVPPRIAGTAEPQSADSGVAACPNSAEETTPTAEPTPPMQPNPAAEPTPPMQPNFAAETNDPVESNPLTEPNPAAEPNPPIAQVEPNPAVLRSNAARRNREVRIWVKAADGVQLAGRWYPASGTEATGRTVVLLHGYAEPSGLFPGQRLAAIHQHGWNVLAVDLRAYGQSGGLTASFGGREADDVRVWIGEIGRLLGPERPILPALWGRSMGAAIALRSAALCPEIKALVLESTMVDLQEAVATWFRKRRFPAAGFLAWLVVGRAGRLAGTSLATPPAAELASRVSCPALFLHGLEDALVPAAQIRSLARAFPSPADVIEVAGAGHADVVAVGGAPLLEEVMAFLGARAGGA
jgi:competence protein ComEC